jgi:hypothetical protein
MGGSLAQFFGWLRAKRLQLGEWLYWRRAKRR